MPLTIARMRKWFALAAVLVVAIVAMFYLYAQIRARQEIREIPQVLGLQIQQSTNGFTLSKSEGGRTLFTVRAAREVEFKTGGRAELHDVNIIVYGRQANRFDQISGKKFDYDPRSGDVVARGEVHIDLQANEQGPARPDQATPAIMQNPIHVDTSALTFNQRTGNAVTAQPANFRLAQASGSAVGVSYESKTNTLTLQSQVDITTSGPTPSHILAAHATVTKEPRQVVMERAQISRPNQVLTGDRAILFLRANNSVERVLTTGHVHGQVRETDTTEVRSEEADFQLGLHNNFESGVLTGGVTMQVSGKQPMEGSSGRAFLWFGEKNQLTKLRAVDHVKLVQSHAPAGGGSVPAGAAQIQQVELDSDALDVQVKDGNLLNKADTSGAAQIVLVSSPPAPKPGQKRAPPPVRTTVTARKFHADFDDNGRMRKLHGAPDARIVSTNPGQPDRVSTSQVVDAYFDPDLGGIAKAVQTGSVHYIEASRQGWAENAVYTPADANLLLTGSPRVIENGGTTTGDRIVMNREQGTALAQGNVKSTYSDLKPQPGGAMLAASDPVHVTSTNMTADRDSGVAVYTGDARLWQGANIVQAPQITFNRAQRSVLALGDGATPVMTVFVQTNAAGQVTPVNVTAKRLDYSDPQRQAVFSHEVVAKSADGTITSDEGTVYLLPRKQAPAPPRAGAVSPAGTAPSELDKIVARGHVVIQQPTRRGHGEQLVYTAADGRFVLSGGSPQIVDAQHGTTRGDSLIFYNRDDRVVVQGKSSSPTLTQTRVDK
jgi:lipopolysaccharide export system protein LptA